MVNMRLTYNLCTGFTDHSTPSVQSQCGELGKCCKGAIPSSLWAVPLVDKALVADAISDIFKRLRIEPRTIVSVQVAVRRRLPGVRGVLWCCDGPVQIAVSCCFWVG